MAEVLLDESEVLQQAFEPDGVMYDIALQMTEPGAAPSPRDVADIIKRPTEQGMSSVRWALLENASEAKKSAAEHHKARVYKLADQLRLRQPASIAEEDLDAIRPDRAVWVVEGGGNRTSIVRRFLATEAMRGLYGDEFIESCTLYQLGATDRQIPRLKPGTSDPNPEFEIAKSIAPGLIDDETELTEHGLNLATSLQAGYADSSPAARATALIKPGAPRLLQVPITRAGRLHGGLSQVAELEGGLSNKQLVIVTNGQYRPKDEILAEQWAENNGVDMLPPVVLGDEAGYTVEETDATLVTASRSSLIYVNELPTLWRLRNPAA